MTQLSLFETTPEPPPIDPEWLRKCERFEELIDLDLDRKATRAELLELSRLRAEGVMGR